MKTLDIFLSRNKTESDYIMLKSFLLSLNGRTEDDAEFYLKEARKVANNPNLSYEDIEIIKWFLSSIKRPNLKFNKQTQSYEKVVKPANPSQEVRISIQKLNIRGLEKFIKDLNDQLSKVCPLADKVVKLTEEQQTECVNIMKDHKLVVEFTNAEGNDVDQYIKEKINYTIDKIYQAEYEKKLKDTAAANEAQKQTSKNTYSGLKKRSSKRRSNLYRSDSAGGGYETDMLPNQKLDEIKNAYSTKFRKYLDRIKSEVVSNTYGDMFTPDEIKQVYLFDNYQVLAQDKIDIKEDEEDQKSESKQEEDKEENPNEEKKRGRKKKSKVKKSKITDRFNIGGEEELNVALKDFFLLLSNSSGINMYDFCLQLVEYVLSNKNHCQYLIYAPNSLNFLSIFQKVYQSLYDWENTISLESLLFLAEIILKTPDNCGPSSPMACRIVTKIANYNIKLLDKAIEDDFLKARI